MRAEDYMLRIRLRRTGKTKQPHYRVVVADANAKRDGDFVEVIGHYNPRSRPKEIFFKEDRVRHWLDNGAQPSETVHRLLFAQGLTTVEPPKRVTVPSKAEVEAGRAAAEAEAARAAEVEAAARAAAEQAAAAVSFDPADDTSAEPAEPVE